MKTEGRAVVAAAGQTGGAAIVKAPVTCPHNLLHDARRREVNPEYEDVGGVFDARRRVHAG